MPMKIAVLGGGHGAYAAAADLSEQGHEVWLWRRDQAAFAPVLNQKTVALTDERGRRDVKLHPTIDIGKAVSGAELVLLPGPATAQLDITRAMTPHLASGQVVFMPPGTFGSFAMAQASGFPRGVLWAETGTLPYLARKRGPAEVAITVRAVRLPTGVFPARDADAAIAVLQKAYPAVHSCGNALSGALMNAGPIIHPPLILMNAAPLEHSERYDIHNEGTQPSVRAVTNRLDAERITLREALSLSAPHYPLADHYTSDRWMYGDAHRKLVKSGDWREKIDLHTHRYMTEDVVLGLAFLVSVARWAKVPAPIAEGLLAMGGAILGKDLLRGERTLEALGLAGCSREELFRKLEG
jgi:opine dehydrogenase